MRESFITDDCVSAISIDYPNGLFPREGGDPSIVDRIIRRDPFSVFGNGIDVEISNILKLISRKMKKRLHRSRIKKLCQRRRKMCPWQRMPHPRKQRQ